MHLRLILLVLMAAATANATSLNDIAILLPLPTEADFAQLLSPADQGATGTLVPKDLFTRFGRFAQGYPSESLYNQGFKVIAVRIDPCFTEGIGPQACRHQIRLVWQPVLEGNHGFTTLDTALHSFYEFKDESEWRAIVAVWPRQSEPSLELGINAQMKAQTLQGPFWQSLKALLLAHCGEGNLVRLTAMSSNTTAATGAPAIVWLFQGFNVATPGQAVRMTIARIGRSTQVLINTDTSQNEYEGEIAPPPPSAPQWNAFLGDSVKAAASTDIKSVIDQAFENENPQRQNTGTLDCVSCHVAQDVRHWGETRFATRWNWSQDFSTKYQSLQPLKNTTPIYGTNRVRSFGYFGQDPVISQRLINETAAIVSSL